MVAMVVTRTPRRKAPVPQPTNSARLKDVDGLEETNSRSGDSVVPTWLWCSDTRLL